MVGSERSLRRLYRSRFAQAGCCFCFLKRKSGIAKVDASRNSIGTYLTQVEGMPGVYHVDVVTAPPDHVNIRTGFEFAPPPSSPSWYQIPGAGFPLSVRYAEPGSKDPPLADSAWKEPAFSRLEAWPGDSTNLDASTLRRQIRIPMLSPMATNPMQILTNRNDVCEDELSTGRDAPCSRPARLPCRSSEADHWRRRPPVQTSRRDHRPGQRQEEVNMAETMPA